MKNLRYFFSLAAVFLLVSLIAIVNEKNVNSNPQEMALTFKINTLKQAILNGFQKGQVAELYPYFDEILSICIDDKEEIYLAYNAKSAMQHFFAIHPPAKFKITHNGKSKGGKASYWIGDYQDVNSRNFRIYILAEKALIQEIEIEVIDQPISS